MVGLRLWLGPYGCREVQGKLPKSMLWGWATAWMVYIDTVRILQAAVQVNYIKKKVQRLKDEDLRVKIWSRTGSRKWGKRRPWEGRTDPVKRVGDNCGVSFLWKIQLPLVHMAETWELMSPVWIFVVPLLWGDLLKAFGAVGSPRFYNTWTILSHRNRWQALSGSHQLLFSATQWVRRWGEWGFEAPTWTMTVHLPGSLWGPPTPSVPCS